MPRRIVIHAGFHKTGTTTIQATLRENRALMKAHSVLRLRWHMQDLVAATRGYSTWGDPLSLIKVEHRFDRLMTELPNVPRRVLIISAEELAGHLPGRRDIEDYSAARTLLRSFSEIAHRHFPSAEVVFYLSTRAPDPWLKSAYWEHVKASSMTLDFDAFRERTEGGSDLDGMVAYIAESLSVPVHHKRLEACRNLTLGPAEPLLDLCDLPANLRAQLQPVSPRNSRLGDDVLQALLEINRTVETTEARKAAKAIILSEARAI